jgi:hypothetical protein
VAVAPPVAYPDGEENGKEHNPARWPDGTYSIEGAADRIGVTVWTIHKWVRVGRIEGRQRQWGMPWKLSLNDDDIIALKEYVQRVRRVKRSKIEAS